MEYRTERLILRTAGPDDLAEVARTWPSDRRPVSREEAEAVIRRMERDREDNAPGRIRHLCLAVCGKEDPAVIMGWCGLDGRYRPAEPEIFVLLDGEHQGRGYGTECVRELLRVASEDYELKCVRGGCAADNAASRRAMEKGGMVRCGAEDNGDPRYVFRPEK